MRNPDWVRDEVIIALDLYVRAGRKQLPATHPDVIRVSELLRRLPIHGPGVRDEKFRNPDGINMILGNFLGVDPAHPTPGLSRKNRLQEEVWRDFAEDPAALRRAADAIERALDTEGVSDADVGAWAVEEVFPEGEILTRLHLARERNRTAVERKKEQVRAATGRLACEVCSFDFAAVYGTLGEGFAECHHTRPLAELPGLRVTRLSDLALVCANCHRMLHRSRPVLSIEGLRAAIAGARSDRRA
jgi:5-methylcytosine-specific restriction protein A